MAVSAWRVSSVSFSKDVWLSGSELSDPHWNAAQLSEIPYPGRHMSSSPSISLRTLSMACLCVALASCGGSSRLEPRFVAVHNTLSSMGYAQTGSISEGSLPESAEASVEVELRGGECYAFLALGVDGVSDINVRVFEGEEEIARDVTHDSQAAARACPTEDGIHRVVVTAITGSGGYLLSSWSGGGSSSGGFSSIVSAGEGTCASPIVVTTGEPYSGTTTGAAATMDTPCVSEQGSAPERVHSFELTERTQITARITSSYDGTLYIMRQCGGEVLGCNDDEADTTSSRVDLTLEPGTYYAIVDGFGSGAQGSYELTITETVLQDVATVCQAAPSLIPGQAVTGTTVGRADYFQSTCADGSRSPDHVYQLDVPQRSRLRVRQQSAHDGSIYVRSACANAASEIACDDDFVNTNASLVTQFVDPGTYWVYSDGYGGAGSNNVGTFSLTADLAPAAGGNAPADTCAAAVDAPTSAFEVDTFQATDTMAGSCGGQGAPEVVYKVTLRQRSRVQVNITRSEFQGALYVRRTCADASSESYCATITRGQSTSGTRLPGNPNMVPYQVTLDPGQYFFVFDGQRPESFGQANVEFEIQDVAAQRRACQRAPLLRPGRTTNGTTNGQSNQFEASCASGARSGEQMYRLRVARRSDVRIRVSATYDAALYIRRDCQDQTTELACNDDSSDSNHSEIVTTLDRGTYFVFVDGFGDASRGDFSLDVETGAAGSIARTPQPPNGRMPVPNP